MDDSQCGILRLPLEIRYQLYHMCFHTWPEPSLLRVNKLLHEDCMHFLRTQQKAFSFNISARGAGFDAFSHWCFKVKRQNPRIGSIKDLTLNIYPPDQNKPHEMWHIWDHVRSFCKEIAKEIRIPKLTVNFVETERYRWAAIGMAHATMRLPYKADEFGLYDVEQIILTLDRFLINVRKPRIILPRSYINIQPDKAIVQEWIDTTESLMSGPRIDERVINEYRRLNDEMDVALPGVQTTTGRISKALFEKLFGQNAILGRENFEDFKREWPHMDTLDDLERPRCRPACHKYYCLCNGSSVEISMPDPSWRNVASIEGVERAERWQQETLPWSRDVPCGSRRTGTYVPGTTLA